MDSIVTEFKDICFFCGRPADCEHHLLFGKPDRQLAEQDGLKVPSCDKCHNMGRKDEKIHGNVMAEKMSKMIGQALWEREYFIKKLMPYLCCEEERNRLIEEAREIFRKRYGKSFL